MSGRDYPRSESAQLMKARRLRQRQMGRQHLLDLRIPHEMANGGARLRIEIDGVVLDYWPGTGRWLERGSDRPQGRGSISLVRRCRELDPSIPGEAVPVPARRRA